MDSTTSEPFSAQSGYSRLAREALIVLLVALGTYAFCFVTDMEPAIYAWRMRPSMQWVGPLGPVLLAATIASGILSLAHRRALVQENLTHREAERAFRVRTEQLEALRRVGLQLTTQRDPDALLRYIVARAVELVGGDSGGLYLHCPEADVLEWALAVGPHPSRIGTILRRGEGLSGCIWDTGRPLAVADYRRWQGRAAVYDGFEFVAVVGAPVVWGDAFLGVLNVISRRAGAFGDPDAELLSMFATQAAVAIENARLYESARGELAERQRLEQQLIQAQKMEAVGRLAGGVAHDFYNLLTVINGYSDFLLRNADLPEHLRVDIDEIHRAGERAADLTRQLLAFGRRQMQELRVFSLNDVLREMARMLHRLIGENVSLVLALANDPLPIRADRSHIEQAVVNLAVNACDAMPQGGALTIQTESAYLGLEDAEELGVECGHYVVLSIRDTGQGMTPDVRAHLFEPFFTTKGPGQGTGLGLATVYGIVKQSGGEIRVRSELGRGTEFCIYLPCCHDGDPGAPLLEPSETLPRGGETILVVEDEERVRRFACSVLHRLGYTVLEARDGIAALERMSEAVRLIDMVVTDVVMPRMGGRDLAARVRALHPDLPVLFMSGYSGDDASRSNATSPDLVHKPFTAEVLAGRVREALDAAEADMPVD